MDTTLIITLVAVIIVVLALVFLRRHDDSKSDYKEEPFVHSGKKWVFNGILDIDHPPMEPSVFTDYEGKMELMVKKDHIHHVITLLPDIKPENHLGMFKAVAALEPDGNVILSVDGLPFAKLTYKQEILNRKISLMGGKTSAYGFVALRYGDVTAEACICCK